MSTPFGKTKVAAYTISTMVPCMSLYAFIGKKLHSLVENDGSCHPYKKWIDNYACQAFQVGYAEKMTSVWETVVNKTSGYVKRS